MFLSGVQLLICRQVRHPTGTGSWVTHTIRSPVTTTHTKHTHRPHHVDIIRTIVLQEHNDDDAYFYDLEEGYRVQHIQLNIVRQ